MINFESSAGISGEFTVTVERADGSIKHQSHHKNLILENAFRLLTNTPPLLNNGTVYDKTKHYLMEQCFVGTGTTLPVKTDVSLASSEFWYEYGNIITPTEKYRYLPSDDSRKAVRVSRTARYSFTNIANKNITEVGLGSYIGAFNGVEKCYALFSRALILDHEKKPISITVLPGERLYVDYTLFFYYDVQAKKTQFTLTTLPSSADGEPTTETYDCVYLPTSIQVNGPHVNNVPYHDTRMSTSSWQRKSDDTVIDLSAPPFSAVAHKSSSLTPVFELFNDEKSTYSSYPLDTEIGQNVTFTADFSTLSLTTTIVWLIGSHNHERGISRMQLEIKSWDDNQLCLYGLFIAKVGDKSGIPKTNKQQLKFSFTQKFSRWEDVKSEFD